MSRDCLGSSGRKIFQHCRDLRNQSRMDFPTPIFFRSRVSPCSKKNSARCRRYRVSDQAFKFHSRWIYLSYKYSFNLQHFISYQLILTAHEQLLLERITLPGIILQSVLIGGGYATGREIIEYGGKFGASGWVCGLAILSASRWSQSSQWKLHECGKCTITNRCWRKWLALRGYHSKLFTWCWPSWSSRW